MTYFHSNLSLFRMRYNTGECLNSHRRVIPIIPLNQFLSMNTHHFSQALKILVSVVYGIILWIHDFSQSLRIYLEIILRGKTPNSHLWNKVVPNVQSFHSANYFSLRISQNDFILWKMNLIIYNDLIIYGVILLYTMILLL